MQNEARSSWQGKSLRQEVRCYTGHPGVVSTGFGTSTITDKGAIGVHRNLVSFFGGRPFPNYKLFPGSKRIILSSPSTAHATAFTLRSHFLKHSSPSWKNASNRHSLNIIAPTLASSCQQAPKANSTKTSVKTRYWRSIPSHSRCKALNEESCLERIKGERTSSFISLDSDTFFLDTNSKLLDVVDPPLLLETLKQQESISPSSGSTADSTVADCEGYSNSKRLSEEKHAVAEHLIFLLYYWMNYPFFNSYLYDKKTLLFRQLPYLLGIETLIKNFFVALQRCSYAALTWSKKQTHFALSQWPRVDAVIQWRILLLTLYFGLHYFMLSLDVWDSPVFCTPPSPPTLYQLYHSASRSTTSKGYNKAEIIKKFVSLVHPHIDSHAHLNVPLSQIMRNGIGLVVAEWVALLWLSSSASLKKRIRLFGLLSACTLFVNVTGTIWGGLSHKTVLFPDIWDYIYQRLQTNFLGRPREELLLLASKESTLQLFPSFVSDWKNLLFGNSDNFLLHDPPKALTAAIPLLLLLMYLLDITGFFLSCLATYRFLKPTDIIGPLSFMLFLLMLGQMFLKGIPQPNARDHHWIDFRPHVGRDFLLPSYREPPVYISRYVKMTDGVELAADVYLPPKLVAEVIDEIPNPLYQNMYRTSLGLPRHNTFRQIVESQNKHLTPTLLIVTRYNRRMVVHWPFTFMPLWGQKTGSSTTNVWSWQFVDALVTNGYAVVVVDTRGTGASFGQRPVDFGPAERQDLKTLSSWISTQFWYDGTVAAGGFSYDGMTGLHLAASENIQAVLALFTPINVVHDLIQPGGLVCSSFVEDYTGLTMAFERFGTPRNHMLLDFSYDWHVTAGFLLTFGLAAPVKSREASLPQAISQHQGNWNMSSMVEAIHFTDDFVVLPKPKGHEPTRIAVTEFEITEDVVFEIGKSNASVYIVGGYCDAASVRGAARLFEGLQRGRSIHQNQITTHELILGPWTHTGRRNCSPYSGGTNSHFEVEMYWDTIRFLDCHLRKRCWNPTNTNRSKHLTKPVHYWSVGDERWMASDEFPPKDVKELDLVFDGSPVRYVESLGLFHKTAVQFCHWSEAIRQSLGKAFRSSFKLMAIMIRESMGSYTAQRWPIIRIIQTFYIAFQEHWEQYFALSDRNAIQEQMDSYRLISRNRHYDTFEMSDASSSNMVDTITYEVDYNASTRGLSRWVIAKHPFRMPSYSYRELKPHRIPSSRAARGFSVTLEQFINFPFWSFSSGTSTGQLLMFTSPPLSKPLRIVGSPLLRFSLNLTEELEKRAGDLERNFFTKRKGLRINELLPIPALDVTVFGYLEDVDLASDEVHYVTEGRILLSHRPTVAVGEGGDTSLMGLSDWENCVYPPQLVVGNNGDQRDKPSTTLRQKARLGSADVVYQTGDRQHHRFAVGGIECVVFTFEPVAWYFRPGHAIRLSLVGADRANFHWSRTQSKEDADLLDRSLLSAVRAGGGQDKLREVRGRGMHVEQPEFWNIPLKNIDHEAFLKLPILE